MTDVSIPYTDLKAIFFDVGGTLVGMNYQLMAETLTHAGLQTTPEQAMRAEVAARPVLSDALAQANDGVAEDFFAIMMGAVIENIPGGQTSDKAKLTSLLTALIPPYGRHQDFWTTPLPGAITGLRLLKEMGIPLVAVSNSDGSAEPVLEKADMREFFEGIIDSHHVGVSKPDPAIFNYAFKIRNTAPHETLYIGDIYAGDVIAARRAGLHAALVDPYDDYQNIDCPTFPTIEALAIAMSGG